MSLVGHTVAPSKSYAKHRDHPGRVLSVVRYAGNRKLCLCRVETGYPTNWIGEEIWLDVKYLTSLNFIEVDEMRSGQTDFMDRMK